MPQSVLEAPAGLISAHVDVREGLVFADTTVLEALIVESSHQSSRHTFDVMVSSDAFHVLRTGRTAYSLVVGWTAVAGVDLDRLTEVSADSFEMFDQSRVYTERVKLTAAAAAELICMEVL